MPFHDSDWDRAEVTSSASRPRHLIALVALGAAAAGAVLGASTATLWWKSRPAEPAAPPAVAATPLLMPAAPAAGPPAASSIATAPEIAPKIAPDVVGAPIASPSAPVPQGAAAPPAPASTAAHRRELAWQRHYVRPPECAQDRRGDRLVECANHYIRARREFEATYSKR